MRSVGASVWIVRVASLVSDWRSRVHNSISEIGVSVASAVRRLRKASQSTIVNALVLVISAVRCGRMISRIE